MFVQVIQGRVADARALRAAFGEWRHALAGASIGWLGSTAGITADGRFISLVRFESEQKARRNSERPEQDKWWGATASLFAGDVTFLDSEAVDVDLTGDPHQAGFVQVIQQRTTDAQRTRALMARDATAWAAFRPEVLGSMSCQHAEGLRTTAVFFASEEEARAGEHKPLPPALAAQVEESNALADGPATYFDLRDPWSAGQN